MAPWRSAVGVPAAAVQARLDLEIKHHDRLVNAKVDYIRGTHNDPDGDADGGDADDEDEDEEEERMRRASGLAGRAGRDRNDPGEYLRRVRALHVDLPSTPVPTAGHESDASDDGAVAVTARRRRGSRRRVRAEFPPVELARRLDDVVRYMHVGPGPAVVAPPPTAMDPRRGAGAVREGYVMSPDSGAVITPQRPVVDN
ncbi:hypothetical protein AMAG_08026 [Allomyces macrogynus ATCC 38327]|uniref:Uncharacterized protein n=1 Tax=Allomyces macrogynus (strain ATCC 38327) TaxID=578462 RepID=A0A0L0SK32_ALLM3|nr:hypothetical protein AMAG_08026 [Allomyces macrogynus ATCC 38327]|eukprot:KNE62847.1 hypothetical protein AMAG_08026 [Allomyces macrogynus ATCC 38327]